MIQRAVAGKMAKWFLPAIAIMMIVCCWTIGASGAAFARAEGETTAMTSPPDLSKFDATSGKPPAARHAVEAVKEGASFGTVLASLMRIGSQLDQPSHPKPVPPAISLAEWLPAIELRTLLIGLHLIGLCLGLGGATMLDFWIFRWMRWGYLPDDIVRTFEFVSKVVFVGLGLLWVSGIGFLALYAVASPDSLANPKLLAKLLIVAALTINGDFIHRIILPYVVQHAARPLLTEMTPSLARYFIWSGVLSAVSWYAAFALGLLREFNNKVDTLVIVGIWLGVVLLAIAVTTIGRKFLVMQVTDGSAARAELRSGPQIP